MVLKERREYWPSGELRCHWYVDDKNKAQGTVYWYFINGILGRKTMTFDGLEHGEKIDYDETGELNYHYVYIHGKLYTAHSDLSEIDRFELSLKYGIEWFDE